MGIGGFVKRVVAQGKSWLRAITRRDGLESGMEAELADHLERLTADLVRSGYAPAEAARRARIALGPALVHKEGMRASLGLRWWDELGADLRFAVRLMRKNPGFTAVAALSLALAIGANTTIFSVAKSLLYDQLKVPHPEELRLLRWTSDGHLITLGMWGDFDSTSSGGLTSSIFSYPVYRQLRAQNAVMQDLFAFTEDSMNATVRGNAQRVVVAMVSGNYYAGLGVQPQLGRSIQPADELPGTPAVAVISDGMWKREFAASPAVVGQTITVNHLQFSIVGVNPRGFTGAKIVQSSPDVFVALSMQPSVDPKGRDRSLLNDTGMWWVTVMGRRRAGVQDAQAEAALNVDLSTAVHATMKVKAGESIPRLNLVDGERGLRISARMFEKPVYVLLTLTGFVLLLACANIANLLLARGARREREMGVRLALGAGRARILRQLLTESLLLSAIGGAGGLLVAWFGQSMIPRLLTNEWEPNNFTFHLDGGIFAFAAGVTLLTGLIFGLAPAWLSVRSEVASTLKDAAQTTTRRRRGLAGKLIVALQIALSTLLVAGAGLFLRTLIALNSVDVGFRTDHLVLFEVDPPAQRYGPGKDVQLHQRLEQGFAAIPGVESVAPNWTAFLANNMSNQDFLPEGETQPANHGGAEDANAVGDAFFQTMGIPIVAGRNFDARETATSEKVAIINEALAKKRFPNVNPVGRRFLTGDEKRIPVRIVGICADTRYANLRDTPPAQFFMPYVQQPEVGRMTYAIRTALSPAELVPALRRVVQQIDPDLPMIDLRTQREQINANMQMERAFAALTTSFGVLALALACVGIYGVMAYNVSQRTNEIGIRLALGAQPSQVRGMILGESAWLALAGIVGGVAAELALARLVKSMLYGIQPYDPLTTGAGVLILLLVALAASWIPARRAARVQPIDALRHE